MTFLVDRGKKETARQASDLRPLLRTGRLLLRPVRPRDAGQIFEAIDESRAYLRRWLPFPDVTHSPADTLAFIRKVSRGTHDVVWGIWEQGGVQPLGRGRSPARAAGRARVRAERYCGNLGLHRIQLEQGSATIGYWVRESSAGRGYASEATAAVLLWLFTKRGFERVAIEAATGNAVSQRVIRKLGFVREGVLRAVQKLPTRRRRLDWITYSLIRRDLPRVRGRLERICGRRRPWQP